MLEVGSALKGYRIEAGDGAIGIVSDFLFDDRTWKVRWLVVDTGNWLTGRLVLVHPSAIGRANYIERVLPVRLTKAQVEASPDVLQDRPVSRQNEFNLNDYYGWDPAWGSSFYGPNATAPDVAEQAVAEADVLSHLEGDDPHLRSLSAATGNDIEAADGAIGHLENVLLEDDGWGVRYLIIDTKNWRPGQHVLVSPYAVREISWSKKKVFLNVSREKVKSSPPWAPLDLINEAHEKRLHRYYDWPGYGW
jgi:PRC-barrel domain